MCNIHYNRTGTQIGQAQIVVEILKSTTICIEVPVVGVVQLPVGT